MRGRKGEDEKALGIRGVLSLRLEVTRRMLIRNLSYPSCYSLITSNACQTHGQGVGCPTIVSLLLVWLYLDKSSSLRPRFSPKIGYVRSIVQFCMKVRSEIPSATAEYKFQK